MAAAIAQSQSGSNIFRWSCPSCRADYAQPFLPGDFCWCGRYYEPHPNPMGEVTHSCFEPCPRKPLYTPPGDPPIFHPCSHPCPLRCHPGPCPKCMVIIGDSRCRCGREGRRVQCAASSEPWSCGKVCGRELNCRQHQCDKVCHEGVCAPCNVKFEMKCLCGRETKQILCGDSKPPRCENVCGKLFRCGRHVCLDVCHASHATSDTSIAGNGTVTCSRPCPRDPDAVGSCPCGRVQFTEQQKRCRQVCTDPIPTCDSKCDRLLPRCPHYCQSLCHEGPCAPCAQLVTAVCRCGSKTESVACPEASDFRCDRICNKKKRCNRHRCTQVCCPDFQLGPNTEAHLCLIVCNKLLSCGMHYCDEFCHMGLCPPCEVLRRPPIVCACGYTVTTEPLMCGMSPRECPVICGKLLQCGHTCLARCHFGECPKCLTLVDRPCAGGHTTFQAVQCWLESSRIFCRSRCGKLLESCGTHTCPNRCHGPTKDCGPCTEPCAKLRQFCSHTCQALCHPTDPMCPDVACTVMIETKCDCGFKVQNIQCGKHSGMRESVSVQCDLKCKEEKRRIQLAEAFSDVERPLQRQVSYDDELVNWARFNRALVDKLDRIGDEVIRCGTSYTESLRHEDLVWVDYYLQFYWRFGTMRRKDVNDVCFHLVIQKDPSMVARVVSPKLSELPFDTFPDFSRSPKPAQSFVRSNVIRYGLNSCIISCEEVFLSRTTNEVVRRLDGVRNQWRLRWAPTKIINRQQPSNRSSRRADSENHEQVAKRSALASSSFGLISPRIVIEAVDESLGAEILDILNRSSSFFGCATLVSSSSTSKKEVTHQKRVAENDEALAASDQQDEDDEWTTVNRRRR